MGKAFSGTYWNEYEIPVSIRKRKKPVIHTKTEFEKIVDVAYHLMHSKGIVFPISDKSRKASVYFHKAQRLIFSQVGSDRCATFGTHNRKKFINELNKYWWLSRKLPVSNFHPAAPVQKPVQVSVAADLSPSLAKAIIEIASMVRDHLSKDKEVMQLFTTTLLGLDGLK